MKKYVRLDKTILAATCICLSGCSLIGDFFGGDGDKPVEQVAPSHPKSTDDAKVVATEIHHQQQAKNTSGAVDVDEFADMQLKLTRLTARLAEIEEGQSRQQERLKIIERGLTLGIVPDELVSGKKISGSMPKAAVGVKHGEGHTAVKSTHVDADDVAEDLSNDGHAKDEPHAGAAEAKLDPAKTDEFNKLFAAAHDDFRAGRYGKAIVGFSDIGKNFDPAVTKGVQDFWIARSWAGLKELQTSRKLFSEFLQKNPASPWAPRAKLEMARVEMALGLRETAMKRFRQIMADHPLEDVSEMAKADVERMSKTL